MYHYTKTSVAFLASATTSLQSHFPGNDQANHEMMKRVTSYLLIKTHRLCVHMPVNYNGPLFRDVIRCEWTAVTVGEQAAPTVCMRTEVSVCVVLVDSTWLPEPLAIKSGCCGSKLTLHACLKTQTYIQVTSL